MFALASLAKKAIKIATTIDPNKTLKDRIKVPVSAKKPRIAGPNRKAKKPEPETMEIPSTEETFFTFPAARNNSGMITENPRPANPKPATFK